MRISFKIVTLIVCFISCESVFSQSAQQALDQGKDINVLFRNESIGGIYVHSRGFGVIYRRYWHVTGKLKRLIEFEGLNMRHPKEISEKTDNGGKSFKYGKLNALLFMRGGFGFQQTLYERADRKSIEVRMLYSVGATVCFSKPVFLQVDSTIGGYISVKDAAYNPSTMNQNNIVGRAPIFEGIQDLKVYPGVYGKLGFSFEYGDRTNAIKAIELGTVVDFFPSAIPIMAYNKPENFFVTLYVAFHFGKRWF
ncbi:MAG: hypothetical protein ACYDCN_15970 [Bacteroidia bacterium]